MKSRQHQTAWQVYADAFMFLFTLSMIIIILMMALIVVNKKTLEKDYHPKGEYMISLTWDDNRNVDLDLWLGRAAVTADRQRSMNRAL